MMTHSQGWYIIVDGHLQTLLVIGYLKVMTHLQGLYIKAYLLTLLFIGYL